MFVYSRVKKPSIDVELHTILYKKLNYRKNFTSLIHLIVILDKLLICIAYTTYYININQNELLSNNINKNTTPTYIIVIIIICKRAINFPYLYCFRVTYGHILLRLNVGIYNIICIIVVYKTNGARFEKKKPKRRHVRTVVLQHFKTRQLLFITIL